MPKKHFVWLLDQLAQNAISRKGMAKHGER